MCEKRSVPFLAHYSGLAVRVTAVSVSEPFLADPADGAAGVIVFNRAPAVERRLAVSCSCKRTRS